jgi:iron(III) transport system ATP-binding protein
MSSVDTDTAGVLRSSVEDKRAAKEPPADAVLRLTNVAKVFGVGVRAVDRLSLDIWSGEFFSLLGPSGCGKTTTLRLIAGLETPDEGEIVYQRTVVSSPARGVFVPPERRQMGMVFQSYAIWPHLTVFENVAYALEIRRVKPAVIKERVMAMLEAVGLSGLAQRQATQLSGGQQQRVALARALVHEPKLLLLDEPFSNLDAGLREHMRVEMKLLQRRLGVTVILVTHDQSEALGLSDRVAVMRLGRCEQVGTPRQLYEQPRTPYVRDFLGKVAVLTGVVEAMNGASRVVLRLSSGQTFEAAPLDDAPPPELGQPASAAIRPEHVRLSASVGEASGRNTMLGEIQALLFQGQRTDARIALSNGLTMLVPLSPLLDLREGDRVTAEFPPEHLRLWPA